MIVRHEKVLYGAGLWMTWVSMETYSIQYLTICKGSIFIEVQIALS